MTTASAPVTAGDLSPPHWVATRGEGIDRLCRFAPNAGRQYAEMRNYDYGPGDRSNVSTLSPWIRHRLVREDEVIRAVRARHSLSSAEKFIQEVVWRTYWKGWLELRPSIWLRYREAVIDGVRQLDRDGDLRLRWEEAVAGRTGIACFDAWARELVDCGYLHNHARMWFASIWIFTLKLPWVLGADFFFRHLLDGDAAVNTLSWRWVAGLQTPGKTYLARPNNIESFTAGRFAAVRGLAPAAVPLTEPAAPPPRPLPPRDRIDVAPPGGLLVTEDDCDPLSLGVPHTQVAAAAGFSFTRARSPLPSGALAASFSRGAVVDALDRVAAASRCPTEVLPETTSSSDVVAWAKSAGIRSVLTPYAPIGPAAEWLQSLAGLLSAEGISLVRIRRDWDDALWPHATKGFFSFKEKVPSVLRQLGVG
ncbi:MAG: deoxyribodipyrimidine photolyase [Rhodospirillales bacterium]|nr:deoxyribodipyrimidine photolyase [Rhodospirillales bacterium]